MMLASRVSHARPMAGMMSVPRSMARIRIVESDRGRLAMMKTRKGVSSGS
jgi:hypothetical protein